MAAGLIVAATLGGGLVAGRAGAAPGTRTLAGGRVYILHAPAQATALARPLVIALHGANQSATTMQRMSGLDSYSDAAHLVVAYGQGVDGRWNAGGCCASRPQDDIGYLRAVVADVARVTPIDPTRVYVLGFSNGGMMAWRAACAAPDLVAGAGVVSGALLIPCKQTKVRVFHVHGTGDATVPLAGGKGFEGHTFPDSRNEAAQVAPGSAVRTFWWAGGHAWPASATGAIMLWLTPARRAGPPVVPGPHSTPRSGVLPAPGPVNR
ncbi:MAG TPA: PHB depolymerase family esterase [Mycobacteriales bacterium]|nr:PHB depolymerase family esterase [Mycobacteriales bacterium]